MQDKNAPKTTQNTPLSYQEGRWSCWCGNVSQLCPCLCAAFLFMSWHHISNPSVEWEFLKLRTCNNAEIPAMWKNRPFEVNHFNESLEAVNKTGTNQFTVFFSNQKRDFIFLLASRNITLISPPKTCEIINAFPKGLYGFMSGDTLQQTSLRKRQVSPIQYCFIRVFKNI